MPTAPDIATALALFQTTTIVLRRSGTNQTAQLFALDFTPKGAQRVLGAVPDGGFTADKRGVAIYCQPDANIQLGDLFAISGTQYRVTFVTDSVEHMAFGDSVKLAWADGSAP